ncbi:uncharacterized protein LOC108250807 [Kryptolebias marmoratus]|uniref:uncharacterized protein LOC108250807 n=1 Tax=Kryptolebias marmoratus TaxID=37003 RepID=UPI000D52F5C9|nr:uncharacterized protein LOC108250807 [Kryptolebias marmoratus]
MDETDVLLKKILKWVKLQKQCARKFNSLADELEETMKTTNVTKVVGSSVSVGGATAMTVAGVLTAVTGGAALPVLATVGAIGALASGTSLLTSVGCEAVIANKSKDVMNEAKQTVEELQKLENEIQDLIKPLKPGAEKGQPSGSCDDGDGDANIMEQLLRSEAKQLGLNLSPHVNLRTICGLPRVNLTRKMAANNVLLAASMMVILQVLMLAAKEGGKKVAKSVGKRAASKAAGCVAGGAVGLLISVPELVSDCQNLDNCETEASKALRENAEAVETAAEEMEKELQKMKDALKRLARVKFIIEKKNRSSDEKRDLIEYVIENTPDEVVRQWLRENAESEVFFKLLDLCNFIKKKVDEEEEEKKRKNRSKKIDLIFVAHGEINNWMIPARCLMPLPSITDVMLYSPWNCLLDAKAAYGIATGLIEPCHRMFVCADPEYCPRSNSDHHPFPLPDNWNSMRASGVQPVPVIMVSPVGKTGDPAFMAFMALEMKLGSPGPDRFVVPFLAPWIGTVPFFVVTLALSLVLLFSQYEATIHLAACLGKTSARTLVDENYLRMQYAYTVDNTGMAVKPDSIGITNPLLFNMLKAVFG